MPSRPDDRPELRVLSIVEALTVTGPVKPLLMFVELMRTRPAASHRLVHGLMTTRRSRGAAVSAADPLEAAAASAGLEYLAVPERGAYDLRTLGGMRRQIERFHPDIVETHDCKSHFLFYLLRRLHGRFRALKWIAFNHGYTRTSLKVSLYQLLDRLTLPRADHVVTVCQPFAARLAERGVDRRRLSVIANALAARAAPSPESVAAARARLGVGTEDSLILCVGRLSREKGQADLIEAMSLMPAAVGGHEPKLVIVGEGPEEQRLRALASGLASRVIFAGFMPDPWAAFHAADLFVLPSHSEGSPLVVYEAMAAGVAIVATNVGGIPETLTDDASALLVPPAQPTALAGAMAELLSHPQRRQRLARGAQAALGNFTPERHARQRLDIYSRVLGAAAGQLRL